MLFVAASAVAAALAVRGANYQQALLVAEQRAIAAEARAVAAELQERAAAITQAADARRSRAVLFCGNYFNNLFAFLGNGSADVEFTAVLAQAVRAKDLGESKQLWLSHAMCTGMEKTPPPNSMVVDLRGFHDDCKLCAKALADFVWGE